MQCWPHTPPSCSVLLPSSLPPTLLTLFFLSFFPAFMDLNGFPLTFFGVSVLFLHLFLHNCNHSAHTILHSSFSHLTLSLRMFPHYKKCFLNVLLVAAHHSFSPYLPPTVSYITLTLWANTGLFPYFHCCAVSNGPWISLCTESEECVLASVFILMRDLWGHFPD